LFSDCPQNPAVIAINIQNILILPIAIIYRGNSQYIVARAIETSIKPPIGGSLMIGIRPFLSETGP
jgi:hypothetical protein